MPTQTKKVMDLVLTKFREVFVFNDDISIATKGSKTEQIDKEREVLKVMDAAELQLRAGNVNSQNKKLSG